MAEKPRKSNFLSWKFALFEKAEPHASRERLHKGNFQDRNFRYLLLFTYYLLLFTYYFLLLTS